jgi:uncharacterized protein YqfB (UPF0267 family)
LLNTRQLVIMETGYNHKVEFEMTSLKLPYGISDFNDIRTEHFFYVDKTMYIEKLERLNSKYLFFIRPRRFGKSLFLSMLEHYYDLNKKDDFDRLFGDLYIGKHPTERRNKYFILYLDFSGLDTSDSSLLKRSFQKRFKGTVIRFLNKYADHLKNISELKNEIKQSDDIVSAWEILFEAVAQSGTKIYLIIDEYDDFTNDIIATRDGLFYKEITHASGFVRSFYKAVKIGTKSVIDRIFITGVSPIMLDDLTSGFNIAENMTMNPICGEMLGFTEGEVRGIVDQFEFNMDPEELMNALRNNYNGYLFYEESQLKVYNPDMILYFFNQWSMFGRFPKNLIDDNVKIDYDRLGSLVSNEQNRTQLEEIILNERVTTQIVSRFSFERMYDKEYFVSLLFYMGLLTIQGPKEGLVELGIPNYVIKTVFWSYFGRILQEKTGMEYRLVEKLSFCVQEMAYRGKIQPFVDFLGELLSSLSRYDLKKFDEKYVKLVILSYLNLTNIYQFISEREVQKGYADILLKKGIGTPQVKYEWLLELKYIKKKNRKQLERIRKKALEQLQHYMESREMLGKPNLKAVALIVIGKDEIIVDHYSR